MTQKPLILAGKVIEPGEFQRIELPSASLYTQTPMNLPVYVMHSKNPGPTLFVTATIHGDEINGLEIIRRLLRNNMSTIKKISGTLLMVPIANIYGFIMHSRYLPDRRDLNRSFPGSPRGSLTARLAHLLLQEIVQRCDYGIDLHTGPIHRSNLPQVRVNLDSPDAEKLAKAFGVPVIINTSLIEGSLRQSALKYGIPIIVYEAGEALRFDEFSIQIGVKGIINIMREIGMLKKTPHKTHKRVKPAIAQSSIWLRATASGIMQSQLELGTEIAEGELIGYIDDPFSENKEGIISPVDGIVIGKTNIPLVNEGDALFHIASFKHLRTVSSQLDELNLTDQQYLGPVIES